MSGQRRVLVSVAERHLDKAAFFFEQFEAALTSPQVTLDRLARELESRFAAHVDALVVGGQPVVEEVLQPKLEAKKLPVSRAVTIVLTFLRAGRVDLATGALRHKAPAVARAAFRACSLVSDSRLDQWILEGLTGRAPLDGRVALLELAAERGLPAPAAPDSLHSEEPGEIAAALRTLRRADPRLHERRVLELLEHPDPLVRDAALMTALHHGSFPAWSLCQSLALDPKKPHPLAMMLLAGLGEPGQHRRLAQLLEDSDDHRPGALRALGYSGNVGLIPLLVFHGHSTDERAAKLACEAIATIAGDEVSAFVRPRRRPRGARADAAATAKPTPPVPPGEATLPALDADAVSAWWREARTRFDTQRRYLGGWPVTRGAFARALTQFPMRRRYLVSMLLSIRTGGRSRVQTRAFTATQRAQIATIASTDSSEAWVREFSFF